MEWLRRFGMQRMEQDNKVFHANIFFALVEWIIITILAYFIGWLIVQLAVFIPGGSMIVFYLGLTGAFPSLLTFAFFGVAVFFYVYGRMITVSVNRSEVIIKRKFGNPIHLPFDSYKFVSIKELGNTTFKNRHLYLRTIDRNGYAIDYRLRYFSMNTYTELISAINASHIEALPVEFRSQVVYEDMVAGNIEFSLLRSEILKREWIIYGKYSGCILVTALLIFLIRSWGTGVTWDLTQILAVFMLLSLPVMAVRLALNQRKCPYKVFRNGSFLFLDDKKFSMSQIEKIVMTDVNAKSNSIFPLNRYIKIYANNKKYKYWVGSEGSLSYREYQEFCREIERMFINGSSKIVYDQK